MLNGYKFRLHFDEVKLMDSLTWVDRELTLVSIESDQYAVRIRYRVNSPFPEDRG